MWNTCHVQGSNNGKSKIKCKSSAQEIKIIPAADVFFWQSRSLSLIRNVQIAWNSCLHPITCFFAPFWGYNKPNQNGLEVSTASLPAVQLQLQIQLRFGIDGDFTYPFIEYFIYSLQLLITKTEKKVRIVGVALYHCFYRAPQCLCRDT